MGNVCTALLMTVGASFLILEESAGSCVTAGSILDFLRPAGSYVAAGLVLSLVDPAGSCVIVGLTSKGEGVGIAPGTGT
jgi:hypothetical protein